MLAGCHGSVPGHGAAAPGGTAAPDAIRAAAADLATADVDVAVRVSVTGWNNWQTIGTGKLSHRPTPAMSWDLPGMQLAPHWLYGGDNLKLILLGSTLYVNEDSLAPREDTGGPFGHRQWQMIDLTNPQASLLGLSAIIDQAEEYTPQRLVDLMATSADLRRTGTETVDGTPTTRYDGTVTLAGAVREPKFDHAAVDEIRDFYRTAQASQAGCTVWLAADGAVRKLSVTMDSAQGTLDLSEELTPLSGAIEAPPAEDVETVRM
jgi:hypothetical protein